MALTDVEGDTKNGLQPQTWLPQSLLDSASEVKSFLDLSPDTIKVFRDNSAAEHIATLHR